MTAVQFYLQENDEQNTDTSPHFWTQVWLTYKTLISNSNNIVHKVMTLTVSFH